MNIFNKQRFHVHENAVSDMDGQCFLPLWFKSTDAARETADLLNRLNSEGLLAAPQHNPKFEQLKQEIKHLAETIDTWVDMQPEIKHEA